MYNKISICGLAFFLYIDSYPFLFICTWRNNQLYSLQDITSIHTTILCKYIVKVCIQNNDTYSLRSYVFFSINVYTHIYQCIHHMKTVILDEKQTKRFLSSESNNIFIKNTRDLSDNLCNACTNYK